MNKYYVAAIVRDALALDTTEPIKIATSKGLLGVDRLCTGWREDRGRYDLAYKASNISFWQGGGSLESDAFIEKLLAQAREIYMKSNNPQGHSYKMQLRIEERFNVE